jgi:hypothetical protein
VLPVVQVSKEEIMSPLGKFISVVLIALFLIAWCPMAWNAIMAGQLRYAGEFSAILTVAFYLGPILVCIYILKRVFTK